MKQAWWMILTFVSLCPHVWGQNVGQIIAAQYGEYKVTGSSLGGFTFPAATCQVSGGGKNFRRLHGRDPHQDCGQ